MSIYAALIGIFAGICLGWGFYGAGIYYSKLVRGDLHKSGWKALFIGDNGRFYPHSKVYW